MADTDTTQNAKTPSEEAKAKETALSKTQELFSSDWSVNSKGEDIIGVFGVKKPTRDDWGIAGHEAFSLPASSTQWENLKNDCKTAGESIGSSWNSIGKAWANGDVLNDDEGVSRVADAASAAALAYFNKKVEKIKSAWTTTQEITVGDLLGEVAPYCIDWSLFSTTLANKLNNMLVYVVSLGSYDSSSEFAEDVDESILEEINSIMSAMLDDPSVESAVSNLKIVKTMTSTMDSLTSIINSAKKIMSVVEPYLPTVEILADLAVAWISGGISASKASQETQEYMSTLAQEVFARAFEVIRKLYLGIKIRMPSLLLGALGTLKVNEATELKEGKAEKVEYAQNLLNGTSYSAVVSARANNSTTGKFYSKVKNTLSKTSSLTSSYANQLKSGNIISAGSFNINSETGEIDYSAGTTQWTDPFSTWVEGNNKLWAEQKLSGYKNVSAVMKSYVADAKRAAGITIVEVFKTGNSEEEKNTSNSSNVDSTLDSIEEIPTTEEDILGISREITP